MPLTYTVDPQERVVVLTCGNTSLATWRRVMGDILRDPRFVPGFDIVVDCRTATLTPTIDDVRGIIGYLTAHAGELGNGRWAVVVDRPAGFGMARMTSLLAEGSGLSLMAFESLDEAHAWLKAEP